MEVYNISILFLAKELIKAGVPLDSVYGWLANLTLTFSSEN